MTARHLLAFSAIGLAAIALAPTGASASPRVGIASVVDGEPIGVPPAGTERVLRVGIDMSADEKVTTRENDRAHLVFLDSSSLTVGPNSSVVIDKFVYDPQRKSGELVLGVGRGTMRFVGGVISKTSEVYVRTPSATMGVRGGILILSVGTNGETIANFIYGIAFTITAQGVTRTVTQPGTQITVEPGQPPSQPVPIPPSTLRLVNFEQGQGISAGGPGGGNNSPTSIAVLIRNALSHTRIGALNSALAPADAVANTLSPQQIAALLSEPGDDDNDTQPVEPRQAANDPQIPTDPVDLQGAGPFQGVGPLLGAGPLLGVGPLQGAGPLLGSGPLTGAPPPIDGGPTGGGPLVTVSLPPDTPIILIFPPEPPGQGGPQDPLPVLLIIDPPQQPQQQQQPPQQDTSGPGPDPGKPDVVLPPPPVLIFPPVCISGGCNQQTPPPSSPACQANTSGCN